MYIVYEIRNCVTEQKYVGISKSSWQFRIQTHLSLLSNNRHFNTKFQEAWNKSSGITDWAFRVLKTDLPSKRQATNEESKILLNSQPDLVLNEISKTGISIAVIRQVRALRKKKIGVKVIAEQLGITMGTVSKIANKRGSYEWLDEG